MIDFNNPPPDGIGVTLVVRRGPLAITTYMQWHRLKLHVIYSVDAQGNQILLTDPEKARVKARARQEVP